MWGEALEICGVGGSIGDLVELWCGGRHWRCSGVVGGVEALEIDLGALWCGGMHLRFSGAVGCGEALEI